MTSDSDFDTEEVSENYEQPRGQMATRTFWIAYPPHVGAYGEEGDRIRLSLGRGDTEAEALADARSK